MQTFPRSVRLQVLCFGSLSIVGLAQPALPSQLAQTPAVLPTDPTRSPDLLPKLDPKRPDLIPLPDATPAPPPKSPLEVPPTSPPSTSEPVPNPDATIPVERVEIVGSTVFSREEFARIVAPYEKRNLTFEQLLEIRTAVTRLYTDRGYVTSGAFLPPQDDLATGVIKIQVIEGELERLEIKGLKRLRDTYIRRRIEIAAGAPLNIHRLETALQLLQLNPLLSGVQAELKAGTQPGRSVLLVSVKETPAVHTAVLLENRDSPSVGSIRGSVFVNHDNLLGFGDRASADVGLTAGITDYSFGYALPINPRDGTLTLRYEHTHSSIVEPPFSILDINSDSQTFSLGFRQPIVRTPSTEFALGLTFDVRESRTFLFKDVPFSFSLGPDRGKSEVRVLRFTQDWLSRTPKRVLAARSQFSFGLPILGATINEAEVDGKFFSWVGQFQWVQSISQDVIAIARVAAQITPDSMLPLEQFSIGGIDTVRGYRQNLRVGDSGVIGSVEVRFPILQQADGIGTVQLAPFVDLGRVWNSNAELPVTSPRTLVSTGLGLRWQVGNAFSARVDWGIPLIYVPRSGDTFQDYGIVFSVRLQLL